MPSTVYKSDLSEITFGHETGVRLEHGYASAFTFTASFETGANAANAPHQDLVKDTSVIVLSGGSANTPVNAGILEYPNGMLVGSKVIFTIASSSPNWDTQDDYAVSGRMYTIIKQEVCNDANNDNDGKTEITVTPALKTNHTAADQASKANDVMTILPFTTPAIDVGMEHADAANASAESVLTDQFVGLVSTVALPETKVDLKRYHVVGLGRDIAVQVPGRFTNVGGSFECNIHNGRWFYYCLGHEVVSAPEVRQDGHATDTFKLVGKHYSGDSYINFDGTLANGSAGSTNPAIGGTDIGVGDYIFLLGGDNTEEVDTVDIQTYRDTGVGGNADDDAWPNVNATNIFDKAMKEEARRIVAITMTNGVGKVWLDDPLQFSYEDNTVVEFARYAADDSNGSPHRNTTTGAITKPVSHLFFSRTTVPSFAMEVSIRRRDIDSNGGTTDGGTGDSKQLTRVFRGCKVKDFSLTTDTDAALRLTANFDSALCYTDTGRLETSNKGDRYNTHRLFEDTAHTEVERKISGIGKGTQKPFMFYNGSISMLGTTLGQVVSFTLNGKTGVEQYYTIGAANIANSATDQVPFAGTRNPTLAVEGKTEYDLEMEIIVDDPLFYHNMRRAVENFDEDSTDSVDADMIRLSFTKQVSSGVAESIDILMDDYYIVEAPLPVPEDKGPLMAKLKILPKSVKVIAVDTVIHA